MSNKECRIMKEDGEVRKFDLEDRLVDFVVNVSQIVETLFIIRYSAR